MAQADPHGCYQEYRYCVVPRGPLSYDSEFYIERPPLEALVFAQVMQPGALVRLKAPRHMGKSSLMLRITEYVKTLNYRHCTIDFLQADTTCFDTVDRFLRWFCRIVAFQLGLPPDLAPYWDEEIGSKVSATIFFEHHLLRQVARPIVLSMNEVNRVFEYREIAEDFLSLLRFWYEQGQRSPLWQNLRMVMAYSTEVYVPLKMEQSPFNVGEQFRLPEFTPEQVRELASRYALDCQPGGTHDATINDLMKWVGGHPHLVHTAIAQLSQVRYSPQLLQQSMTELTGLFSEDLRSCSATVNTQPALTQALQILLQHPAGAQLSPTAAYQLSSLGIVSTEGRRCQFACELYRRHFEAEFSVQTPEPDYRVSQLQTENRKLYTLAYTDALTGLPNRRAFDLQLQQAWQRGRLTNSPLTLMLADIDHFKFYNDTYGHPLGDACLQLVAQILRHQDQSGLTDFVARYGGEEFAVIVPDISLAIATERAEHLRSQVKALTQTADLPGGVTMSIGLATIQPTETSSPQTLVTMVDRVLYQSKRLGRDRVTVSVDL